MRYLTLTLAPSGVDRWFVRYDTNTGFTCFWVNIYIVTYFNFGSTEMWLLNFKQPIKNSEFC
jgi:hypothetical protein